jgi:ferredoxin
VTIEKKRNSRSPQKKRCIGKDCGDCGDRCRVKSKTAEENLLELREENIHLKTHQRELEEEVKMYPSSFLVILV